MTLIITNYSPTNYTLYLNLLTKSRNFIENFCNQYDLTHKQILEILKVLYYNPDWNIQNNLQSLSKIPFSQLPIWLTENKTITKYRMETTFNGIAFNLAKSGIQKYIRRSNSSKSIYLSVDAYLTHWTPGSQAMITNLYNRLRITFLEDISIAAPELLQLVDTTLEKPPDTILSDKLPYLVHCMSKCLHTRCYSHIKSHYRINPSEITPKTPKNHIKLEKDEELRVVVDIFVWCLENKNPEALWWLYKIVEHEKLNTKRFNSTRPGFLIFKILIDLNMKVDDFTIPICMKWYKFMKMKEQILCLAHPVMLYILQEKAIFLPPNPDSWNPTLYESRKPYNKCLLNETILLDNFVYDKHTKVGRDIFKRNSADFALEGSLVAFELPVFPQFAQEYMKEYIDKVPLFMEDSEFAFKIRTQLTTGSSKQDVYFAKNKLKQNVVVKGPFLELKHALLSFNLSNIANLFPHVNVPTINIRLLYPNMWDNKIPLGIRNSITSQTPCYFVEMEDLMNQEKYPQFLKSSKLWKDEPIVDWDKLWKIQPNLGIGIPSTMDDKAKFSLLIQLAFRLAFQIGDNSYRNFLRIGDKVYNIDLEGFMTGTKIQWSAAEIHNLNSTLKKYNKEYRDILTSWLQPGDSYINRWDICRISFSHSQTDKVISNIKNLIEIKNF